MISDEAPERESWDLAVGGRGTLQVSPFKPSWFVDVEATTRLNKRARAVKTNACACPECRVPMRCKEPGLRKQTLLGHRVRRVGQDVHVALNLDFLIALDEEIRANNLGHIGDGSGLQRVAQEAGLARPEDPWSAARWIGELVELGYLKHSSPGLGDRRPVPERWYTGSDLYRFTDYRLTDAGHQADARERSRRRQYVTDAVIGAAFPGLLLDRVDEPRKRAIAEPLRRLRAALDDEHWFDVVGASKDLVEAACKVTIELAGSTAKPKADLIVLAKEAQRARGDDDATPLSRSVVATVQRLAELRNDVGAGHGHSELPEVAHRAGMLAASAASAVAAYLLTGA